MNYYGLVKERFIVEERGCRETERETSGREEIYIYRERTRMKERRRSERKR